MSDFWSGVKHGFNHGIVQNMYAMFGACPFPCVSNPFAVNFSMPNSLCGNFSLYPEISLPFPSANWNSSLNFDCSLSNTTFTFDKSSSVFDYAFQTYQSNSSDFVLYNNSPFDSLNISNTGNKSTEIKKDNGKAPYWWEMTDEEMKALYGNYDYDITTTGEITAEQINNFIDKKYPNSELKGKGQAFIDAENQYGISALAMLGICGVETTYGTAGHAIDGKYNIVNIQREGYKGKGERWKTYNSAEECIMDLAKKLKNNFVESPGKGKVAHLKKLYQVGPKYCPAREKMSQKNWAKSVQNEIDKVKRTLAA